MPFDCVLQAWHAHEGELRGFLIHRLGDVDSADDLLQETFLKSMRQGAAFCEIDNPRAWLFQVARHAVIDRARLAKPQIELPEQIAAPLADERAPVDELDDCLRRNLAEMPAEDRQIIEQCDLQGIRQHDFAQTHGLSLPATKSRLLRARQRLREALIRNCQVQWDDSGHVCCHVPRV
ncbi:MAG: sigma-70 family RNA polymerase sigma factor [Rhodanobacter sp.]